MQLDLIMVDECGDEVKVETFNVGNDLDEDYMELWKDRKIEKARENYPEAQRFYFERPYSDMSYGELLACMDNQKVRLSDMSKLRVWWTPQVGADGGAFYIPVNTVEEGKKIMDLLAAYDAFQLQNRIKPDYCNTGGVQIWNEEESEWEDWWIETEDNYFDDVDEYCEQCEKADELENFRSKLFKQIDWDKIHKMTM